MVKKFEDTQSDEWYQCQCSVADDRWTQDNLCKTYYYVNFFIWRMIIVMIVIEKILKKWLSYIVNDDNDHLWWEELSIHSPTILVENGCLHTHTTNRIDLDHCG